MHSPFIFVALLVSLTLSSGDVLTSGALEVDINASSYIVRVDGKPWLYGGLSAVPLRGTRLLRQVAPHSPIQRGFDVWGEFERVEWYWGNESRGKAVLVTSVRAYRADNDHSVELLAFEQRWPSGHEEAYAGSSNSVIAPFPTFFTSANAAGVNISSEAVFLNFWQWGGCQLANSWGGRWNNATSIPGGDHFGIPTVLFDASGRAVTFGPSTNWLTAVLDTGTAASVGAGVAASVRSLPRQFSHETLLVGGTGISSSVHAYGGALLRKSGKARVTQPHDRDFVLGHLGYWTDNGAFYRGSDTVKPFANNQEMLLAVKARWEAQGIPFRYVQWDDYWQHQVNDVPGVTWWWPTKETFPDGLTDWLGMPTSLYNSMYAANNTYIADSTRYNYTWAIDSAAPGGGSALPVDVQFYRDMFRNGSRARMVMFEQDFLTNYQWTTNLTRYDVHTGMSWLHAMDDAATEANITLQLCMMEPTHVLASTELRSVTNGRGTSDNSHNSQADLYPLGHSGLLHWAMGIWPSRDNVFSSPFEPGCADQSSYNCSASDYRLQNVAAVLSGGPYGPSDGIDFLNKKLIQRSCRADGVLLKPDVPLATTDAAMLAGFTDEPRATATMHVWSTRSVLSLTRHEQQQSCTQFIGWLYVLSVSTTRDMELSLVKDLGAASHMDYVLFDFWASDGAPLVLTPVHASEGYFIVPRSPPPPNNYSDGGTYQVLSPVLPQSGWCLLGEAHKIVTVASRRFSAVTTTINEMRVTLQAASNETVIIWILPPKSTAMLLSHTSTTNAGNAAEVSGLHAKSARTGTAVGLIEVTCPASYCSGEDCDVELVLTCETVSEACNCKNQYM